MLDLNLSTAAAAAQDIPEVAAPAKGSKRASKRVAAPRSGKAYGLLAEQPVSLFGLTPQERAAVVVSAVLDEAGGTVVLSRVVDLSWNLSPFVSTPNTRENEKRLNWARIPQPFIEVCENVLYAYWKRGRPGWAAPGVRTLQITLNSLAVFCRYLQANGIERLADVQPLHVSNFIHQQKSPKLNGRTLIHQFQAIEVLYLFRDEHEDGLNFHPWPQSSAKDMAGMTGKRGEDTRKVGLTPLIPADVAQKLWVRAEGILSRADALLDERDAGVRPAFRDPEILAIRDACAYLLGVLTGVRNSEMSSIEVGAGRTELKGGHTFHWLRATNYKTKGGLRDYLMPSMGHRILAVMERWSQPHRDKLAQQIGQMEQQQTRSADDLTWLATARANRHRLFLGNGAGGLVPVSHGGWNFIFKQCAKDAGTSWDLASHQLRRLYSYTMAKHRLGNLLFVKEQFGHKSIDMSQLYCASPYQDPALYDDILDELNRQKTEVIVAWLDKDEPLAGGAGKRIMEMRAHGFEGRRELLTETSQRVMMRSNGHAWCLSQDGGCGGSGVYEKRHCDSCGSGVVDKSFGPLWLEAYRHHKELLKDAQALGSGFEKRVKADLEREAKVLRELGLDPDAEQASPEEKPGKEDGRGQDAA